MSKLYNSIKFLIQYLIPVFGMAGIIFYLSAQPGLGDIENNTIEMFLRKGAHFTEYGLLTFFAWRLFYNGWNFSKLSAFWIVFILVTLYAGSDEFHQTFVEGRSGKIIDVVVDFFSIFVTLQVLLFIVQRKIKNIVLALVGFACFIGLTTGMAWESYERGNNLEKEKIKNGKEKNIGNNSNKEDQGNQKNLETLDTIKKGVKVNNNEEKETSIKEGSDFIKKDTIDKDIIRANNLPDKIVYDVPFTTQSPFARWNELHEEACEEASLIMLKYYNDKMKRPGLVKLSKEIAEEEIQKLVKYQIKKYGDFYDTDVKTTKQIGEDFYKLNNLKIIENFTIEDLKKELARGNIILIPTAGRELGNQNFTPPGPLYHNLVIIGYDDKATVDSAGRKSKGVFITNDPGTRNGKNYKYNQEILYQAIHDFPGDINKISQGSKRGIVLSKF